MKKVKLPVFEDDQKRKYIHYNGKDYYRKVHIRRLEKEIERLKNEKE